MTVRMSVPAAGGGYPLCSETVVSRASLVRTCDAGGILDEEESRFGLPSIGRAERFAERAMRAIRQREDREAGERLARLRALRRR